MQKSIKVNFFSTVQSWDTKINRSVDLLTFGCMALPEHENTYCKLVFTSVFNYHPDRHSLKIPLEYKKKDE